MRRWIDAVFCLAVMAFVLYVYTDTRWVCVDTLADYYLRNFIRETGAQNSVTAIYLNYRVFDSILETLMLLVSVTAVIYFSWRRDHE